MQWCVCPCVGACVHTAGWGGGAAMSHPDGNINRLTLTVTLCSRTKERMRGEEIITQNASDPTTDSKSTPRIHSEQHISPVKNKKEN